jgi:hypothetical protein
MQTKPAVLVQYNFIENNKYRKTLNHINIKGIYLYSCLSVFYKIIVKIIFQNL